MHWSPQMLRHHEFSEEPGTEMITHSHEVSFQSKAKPHQNCMRAWTTHALLIKFRDKNSAAAQWGVSAGSLDPVEVFLLKSNNL